MASTLLDWLELALRWAHVMSGIAWIGSSFYFIALDAGLQASPRLPPGVKGEAWQVHGGGFYQIQKYGVAPKFLPTELTWFKWEAYTTWIFGFALLVLIYYAHPTLYLIDPAVADLQPWDAVPIAAASLGIGYIAYDLLCRSPLGRDTAQLATVGFGLLVIVTFAYTHLFSGRGAFIQTGAFTGSIMVGNVLFVIMPNQRKTVAALLAGEAPDPRWGAQAKQRSLHNNYLTLPVVFTMISNHYAFTYQGRWSWLVLMAVFLAGFLIRHWFNLAHARAHPDWRLWPAAAVPLAGAVLLTLIGQGAASAPAGAAPASFAQVQNIVAARCHVCHAARPSYPGFAQPPKGIMFDTPGQIVAQAPLIYTQAVLTKAMPLGNITAITEPERQTLASWVQAGAKP